MANNREEILLGYSNRQLRDTWVILGENTIKSTTRVYTEGILYKVDIEDSPLYNYLIYCRNNYSGTLDWTTVEVNSLGELSFGNSIINPNFLSLLTGTEFEEVTDEVDETFVPFEGITVSEYPTTVTISDEDYAQCITCLGAPFVTEEELEYSKEQILELGLRPALEMMNKWWPIITTEVYSLSADVQTVQFPDDAYDIVGWSVQQYGSYGTGSNVSHTLWRYLDESLYNNLGGSTSTSYATSSLYGSSGLDLYTSLRSLNSALINYQQRVRVQKILQAGDDGNYHWYAKFYALRGMVIEISYAMRDYNFSHIQYNMRPIAFKLCNAFVKKLFGNLRRQIRSNNIPGIIDYNSWVTEADKEIEEVESVLKSMVKAHSALRGML